MHALSVYVGDLKVPAFAPVELIEQHVKLLQEDTSVAFVQVEVDTAITSPAAIAPNAVDGFLREMISESHEGKASTARLPLAFGVPQVKLAAAISEEDIGQLSYRQRPRCWSELLGLLDGVEADFS